MNVIRVLYLGAICVPMAWAAPTCVSGTLADFLDLGGRGCSLDGVTFSNFQYLTSTVNATAPPDSSIPVAPVARFVEAIVIRGGNFEFERLYAIGFVFGISTGLGRIEGRPRTMDLDILYQAASSAGINAATAYASVGGDYLSTGYSWTDISGQRCTYVDGNGTSSSGCAFGVTDLISVDHHVRLAVGPAFPGVGGAGISGLESGVVITPEPAGWLLCCPALLVLAGLARNG